jgi:hypothetical protein
MMAGSHSPPLGMRNHLTFSDALVVVRAKPRSASFETSRLDRDW